MVLEISKKHVALHKRDFNIFYPNEDIIKYVEDMLKKNMSFLKNKDVSSLKTTFKETETHYQLLLN